jgi:beta-glucosidase/6-phospho-beta-glucosidase/beta-galactosidase
VIELAKLIGLNSIALNLDWARLEPKKGTFSKKYLNEYKRIINHLEQNKIVPIITLWAWSHPQWFEDLGGFKAKANLKYFYNYVNNVVNIIPAGSTVMVLEDAYGYFKFYNQVFPAGRAQSSRLVMNLASNFARALRRANTIIKLKDKSIQVGASVSNSFLDKPLNQRNKLNRMLFHSRILKEIRKSCDFVGLGINNRSNESKSVLGSKEYYGDINEGDTEKFMVKSFNYLDAKLQMPILVINNGVSDIEQKYYSTEIENSINALFKASLQKANMIGYVYGYLSQSQQIDSGRFISQSLYTQPKNSSKLKAQNRARVYSRLIKSVNKARKPNYQPAVNSIINSINQYKKSKQGRVKNILRQSVKSISLRVDSAKLKHSRPPAVIADNKGGDAKSFISTLSLSGEGVNPFESVKKISLASTAKFKSTSASAKEKLINNKKSVQSRISQSIKKPKFGDFIKKPSIKQGEPKTSAKKVSNKVISTSRTKPTKSTTIQPKNKRKVI